MGKLWGGRFSKETNKEVEEFTKSIHFDHDLGWQDILSSLAHVQILKNAGYLKPDEFKKLDRALNQMLNDMEKDKIGWEESSEDVHTDIQNKLKKKVGDLVLKLHTARSRNDQVVFATKLYCKVQIRDTKKEIYRLAKVVSNLGKRNKNIIIPGFTHLQHAQPVSIQDYLGAYLSMFLRDYNRLTYISENLKITMGAGALAGTPIRHSLYNKKAQEYFKTYHLDKEFNIESTTNSLDAVSDRDFIIEIISALSMISMHLSRMAEDFIIWSTKEFDFIEIDESFCTGSSLMPQKKNPDVLELVRGYTGRLYGHLVSVLTMMKGLPLTYNRDMQLDKEPLFDSFEIISKELSVLSGLVDTITFNKKAIEFHLSDEALYATDLVYYLVDKDVPFKEAHTIIGEMVRYSTQNDIRIQDMPEDFLREKFSSKIVKKDMMKYFDAKHSILLKKSIDRSEDILSKFK